ncbi:DUF7344 domain-containing protein [Halomicrobium urmianum]|uniref:DUF7344 domain-containing protein n=1 Tax=Halomicrobium urmianum TaxID=1586233 RepID=UPI001CDA0904|nr:hypothetical protein [Halomicrobium urmianum]
MDDPTPDTRQQDMLFEVRTDSRRRRLIGLLGEYERTDRAFLDALSARLAEHDAEVNVPAEEIAVELHHCHLPKLDEAGLVRYEPSTKMIEFTGRSEDGDGSARNLDVSLGND